MNGQHACQICGLYLYTYSDARAHLRMKHREEKPFVCDVCGKKFRSFDALKTHLKFHRCEGCYSCELCSRNFMRKGLLQYQMASKHSNQRPYLCDICGKACTTKYLLATHMISHSDEKNYRCEVCKKTFKYPSDLSAHRRRFHADTSDPSKTDLGYHCEICSKSFTQRASLLVHHRLHTGEKPFLCSICQATFYYRYSLKAHEKA